jgi:MoaA/NifB/PqqE/SkfB family radical SAM enzyme
VPERPISAKLELTYHCNLRCGFCYTDSPRRTLERTPELDDNTWQRIVDEAIDLGITRAIITGGEALLRRELALESAERLDAAGVAVTLSTNGWFIDEAVADRLAGCPRLDTHISIDGATPELHEAARGVPGSWRRAVEGVDLLLQRGVSVRALHVVTPQNEHAFGEFLELMSMLGVNVISVTPVVPIGAAARSGDWMVSRLRIRRQVRAFELRTGGRPRVFVHNSPSARLSTRGHTPSGFLVRPNGAFLASSNHPFSFGDAASQPLAECWGGLRSGWLDERVRRWVGAVPNTWRLAKMDLVPYRDEELEVVSARGVARKRSAPVTGALGDGVSIERALEVLQAKSPRPPEDGIGDLAAAQASVRGLAMGRRYRPGALRYETGSGANAPRARPTVRLNRTASMVLDACAPGTPADAVDSLADRYPGVARDELEPAVLGAVRRMVNASVLVPALAADGEGARDSGDESLSTLP